MHCPSTQSAQGPQSYPCERSHSGGSLVVGSSVVDDVPVVGAPVVGSPVVPVDVLVLVDPSLVSDAVGCSGPAGPHASARPHTHAP